ncbi:MAG: hypothetical protein UHK60_13375 [Acutalibacteraceae bacterium]|nr:hypothetical protein [Acutalibacteraceae bacterium]
MQSERYDNIEYNDEWESVPVVRAESVTTNYDYDNDLDEYEEDYDTYSGQSDGYKNFTYERQEKKESNPQPVIKLQFLLAFLVLATGFILKNYGGELYATVSNWYFENLNNSLVVTMKSQNDKLPENKEITEDSISVTDIATKETEANNMATEELSPTQAPTEISSEEASTEATTELPSSEPTQNSGEE